MKTAKPSFTLSHSSANTLRGCEQKYVHYKVEETPKDRDFNDNQEHFLVGKAVHAILENMAHSWDEKEFWEWLDKVTNGYEIPHLKELVAVLAFKLFKLNKKSGLYCVAVEYKILTEHTLGYIDVVMADEDKNWWMVDIKTTSRRSDLTNNKLHNDYQLNLYAAHYKIVARDLGLDPKKFKGCRYRVVTKPKAKLKKNENILGYIKRILPMIEAFDVIVPLDNMNPEIILKRHRALWRRAAKLHDGSEPGQNFAHCSSFFRPCEYWSQCHGEIYSDTSLEILEC